MDVASLLEEITEFYDAVGLLAQGRSEAEVGEHTIKMYNWLLNESKRVKPDDQELSALSSLTFPCKISYSDFLDMVDRLHEIVNRAMTSD